MGQFSLIHWVVVLLVVVLVFGPRRLPELGSSIGEAIRNFKKGLDSSKELPPEKPADDPSRTNKPDQH